MSHQSNYHRAVLPYLLLVALCDEEEAVKMTAYVTTSMCIGAEW